MSIVIATLWLVFWIGFLLIEFIVPFKNKLAHFAWVFVLILGILAQSLEIIHLIHG